MEATASSSPSLVNDVVEEIFLRLPVKSLIRLKSLSKQWRWTIQSRSFAERHLKFAQRSHMEHSKVIAINSRENYENEHRSICFHTLSLEPTPLLSFPLPKSHPKFSSFYVSKSCDGLFCIYSLKSEFIWVVNPATRWFRQLPPARFQILNHRMVQNLDDNWDPDLCYFTTPVTSLAIVKATDYKLVWLYNSLKYNADALSPNEGLTKCEVFDFRANAWRYLTCTPSYRIWGLQSPEYVDGSIFWLTEIYNGEIKVIALDIYTETFRLLPKFHPILATSSPMVIYMCTLDNSLCIMKLVPNIKTFKEIWRLKSSQDVWEKIYTIDLFSCSSSVSLLQNFLDWKPFAICNNKKILLSCPYTKHLVEYDPQTKSVCSFFTHHVQCKILSHVPYIQSLISDI